MQKEGEVETGNAAVCSCLSGGIAVTTGHCGR